MKKMALIFLIIGILCLGASVILYNKKPTPIIVDNKEKGNQFEDFVIQFVSKNQQVQFVSKVSDYYKNGVMAAENIEPDLKFSQQGKKFGVECKWRNEFANNKITWAKESQIINYNNYQSANNQAVFIAIGIGGTPNLPSKLYFVPLYRLTKTLATENYIAEFEMDINKKFVGFIK